MNMKSMIIDIHPRKYLRPDTLQQYDDKTN